MKEQYNHENTDVRDLLEQLQAPQSVVIGLEGGPCSGKTTLCNLLAEQAGELGRPFAALPEAATVHIEQLMARGETVPGLAQYNRPAYLQFQQDIVRTVAGNIQRAKAAFAGTDAVILVDRPDIGAYITRDEYRQVLDEVGLDQPPLHGLIDKLIYLPSVASEEPARYALLRGNNEARYETTAESAAAVCAANLQAVRMHPELHMEWGGDFQQKIRRLAAFILQPELEKEMKQAVPDQVAREFVAAAERDGRLLNVLDITQQYHQLNGQEFRLRTTTDPDGLLHRYFTVKSGEGITRRELQRSLTAEQHELLAHTPQLGNTLYKRRHVVLDEADAAGRRRLWFADEYTQPSLPDWHFETDIEDEAEVSELTVLYGATRRLVNSSAKALIFI
jgi:thymidylate kinase